MLQATPRAALGNHLILPVSGPRGAFTTSRTRRGLGQIAPVSLVQAGTRAGTAGATGGVKGLVISAPSIVGSTLTTAVSSGTLWASSATWAIPVIGAAVAAVTVALMLIWGRKGPKQKVATTHIVDAVEPKLKENLAGYLAGPRTATSQAQAIENFKAGWQWVVDHCGIPEMGDPGQACIRDRSLGGQWDWTAYYLNPIVNDPQVKPDPVVDPLTGELTEMTQDPVTGQWVSVPFSTGLGKSVWLIAAAAAVLVAVMA